MRFSNRKIKIVFEKYGGRCGYCGCLSINLQIDHFIPRSKGGSDKIENLMPSCRDCNAFKSDLLIEEFRNKILFKTIESLEKEIRFKIALNYSFIKKSNLKNVKFFFENFHDSNDFGNIRKLYSVDSLLGWG